MDTRESNETLCQFRRETLKDLLRQLENCACGFDRPIMPFITNRQEQYSEKKTLQLLNILTASCPASLRGFYKSMLYCAIRSFSTPCTIRSGSVTLGVYNPAFTFGDLINYLHSEELEVSERQESFVSFGILKRPISGSLSATMTALYVFLSGGQEPDPNLLEGEFIPLQTCEAEDEPFCPDGEGRQTNFMESTLENLPVSWMRLFLRRRNIAGIMKISSGFIPNNTTRYSSTGIWRIWYIIFLWNRG